MGLFAQFDPLAVRGLVLLQSCPVIVLAARRCTKDSANDETFGAQDLDVVTTNELHCRRRGSKWTSPMLPIIILSLIFGAGFCLGYGARAWRSRKRRARHMLYARYNSASRATTFGHARRAF